MDPIRWLLRAKRWAQHPPSTRQVLLVLTVIAICLGLFAIEKVFGWPDWLNIQQMRQRPIR